MAELPAIARLRTLWADETRSSSGRAAIASLVGFVLGAALLARVGSLPARVGAGVLLLAAVATPLLRRVAQRRRMATAAQIMAATIARTQPELGRAALRALRLTAEIEGEPRRGSAELAHLHLARLVGRAELEPVVARASRRAWLYSLAALSIATGCLGVAIFDPFRVVEGFDVLAATERVAPVPLAWLDDLQVRAEPPAYLNERKRSLIPYFPTGLPAGTVLTVRGLPRHPGRRLELTDGAAGVPFIDDGQGAVVARWTVTGDAEIRVAARFGEVRVDEPSSLSVHSIADHAPHVTLTGAPRTVKLLEEPRIAIHYEATDDHGLAEVVLVLRAGVREERRPLSQPQGGTPVDRGGVDLRADDAFLKRSYLPVEVTVEARDNDPITGPKWGRSRAILIIPPKIAEREALRYAALERARDALVDMLATRLNTAAPAAGTLERHLEVEQAAHDAALAVIDEALSARFGGLRIDGRLAAIIHGQIERLEEALAAERKRPISAAHAELSERTETVVLAADSALGALGYRDTRAAAGKLAEVASEAAASIRLRSSATLRDEVDRRVDASLQVLADGGEQLLGLGSLGLDLGEIVANGLRRIRRAYAADDIHHAQLAAEDLAARLRQPDPSFMGGGGVESGGAPRPGEGPASEAAQQAAALQGALEQLREEHASELATLEQALQDAISDEQREALEEELREQAGKVREAAQKLPSSAERSGTGRDSAAAARSHAEAMAGALERGDLAEAVRQGQDALEALREAERLAQGAAGSPPDPDIGARAGEVGRELRAPLDWAEQVLDRLQAEASRNATEAVERAAEREGELAERARQLREMGDQGDAPMPRELLQRLDEAAEAMDEARARLEQQRGQAGLEKQREAQRLLEMAQPEQEQAPDEGGGDTPSPSVAQDAEVPGETRDERADEFRKRVTDRLRGRVPPELRDALRRYTEGLLR